MEELCSSGGGKAQRSGAGFFPIGGGYRSVSALLSHIPLWQNSLGYLLVFIDRHGREVEAPSRWAPPAEMRMSHSAASVADNMEETNSGCVGPCHVD